MMTYYQYIVICFLTVTGTKVNIKLSQHLTAMLTYSAISY